METLRGEVVNRCAFYGCVEVAEMNLLSVDADVRLPFAQVFAPRHAFEPAGVILVSTPVVLILSMGGDAQVRLSVIERCFTVSVVNLNLRIGHAHDDAMHLLRSPFATGQAD